MKKILFAFSLALLQVCAFAQTPFTAPWGFNYSAPTGAPSALGTRVRFDITTGRIYTWSPDALNWQLQGYTIDQISGTSAPAYAPVRGQSWFAVNGDTLPRLYQYTGSGTAWKCLNCSDGKTYTAGTGITLSGPNLTVINNAGDLSNTNELNTGFDISGGNLRIIDAGATRTVAVTSIAPDQSVTNELQTIDTFSVSGSVVSLSLSQDNQPAKTIILPFGIKILPVPKFFPFSPPFDIEIGADTFMIDETTFNLKRHAGITPVDTLYVNVAVSSSGSGQSWVTAFKGLDEAITAANATAGAKQIRVAKGYYFDQHSWNAVQPTKPLEIIGDLTQGSGSGIYLTTDVRDAVGSFVNVSNYYRATLTQRPGRVYDRSQTDAFGDMRTLTKRASIALVNANAGSWYWNSDTLYVRNYDNRAPDANNAYMLDQYNGLMLKDSITLYAEKLDFLGGGLSFGIPYTTGVGPTKAYINNVTVKGVNGYALSGAGLSEMIIFNSTFAKTDSNDLIGYDKRNLVVPNILEYNVTSYNSSEQNTACGTCNASTSHYNTIVRINGRYSYTYGPTIADVLGANSWNIGVKSFNSRTLADPRAYYFGTVSLPGYYYLQDCKSLNQPTLGTDIVADNQTVNTRNFTGTKTNLVAGTGKIIPHYTYNSDSGGSAGDGGTIISGLTDDYIVKANGTDNVQNSSLFDNGTQVGFNTNSPEATFHVKKSNVTGSASSGSFGFLIEDGAANAVLGLQSDMARYAEIVFGDQWSLADGGVRYSLSTRSTNRKQLQFFTDGFANTAMVIDSTRKVGINNAAPESQLHITQSDVSGSFPAGWAVGVEHNTDDVVLAMKTNSIRSNRLWFGDNTNNALGAVFYYGSSHGTLPNHLQLWTAGAARVWLDETGRLGIGVDPSARLHLSAGTAIASTAPLKLTSGTSLTTPENGAIEYNGTDLFITTGGVRQILAKSLQGSATLDYPSIAADATSDLTITVTGAATTDKGVSVMVPNTAVSAGLIFFSWISATNTVTVRCYNSTGGAIDPASATFNATVFK